MDVNKLREIQEPIKARYREQPASAMVTLKATARTGEGITCKIETGKTIAAAGLHPATGGDGLTLCSGDLLLEALVACAGVTLKAVATAIEFEMEEASVKAEGDLDFRGTLSVDKNAPVGFKEIRLHFDIRTNESSDKIATLIKLTERYCVVYQTLRQANAVIVTVS